MHKLLVEPQTWQHAALSKARASCKVHSASFIPRGLRWEDTRRSLQQHPSCVPGCKHVGKARTFPCKHGVILQEINLTAHSTKSCRSWGTHTYYLMWDNAAELITHRNSPALPKGPNICSNKFPLAQLLDQTISMHLQSYKYAPR